MKFIKVGVSRKIFSEVYLEVPDDFTPVQIMRHHYGELLRDAADELCLTDWNNDCDETEAEQAQVVSEQEAMAFSTFDATAAIAAQRAIEVDRAGAAMDKLAEQQKRQQL